MRAREPRTSEGSSLGILCEPCTRSPKPPGAPDQNLIDGQGKPRTAACADNIHQHIIYRRYSTKTKQLIRFYAERTDEPYHACHEQRTPFSRPNASHAQITNRCKCQNVQGRFGDHSSMPIQVTERDPFDAGPMSSPIKPGPRQTDHEQYTHEPEHKHYPPGSADHSLIRM